MPTLTKQLKMIALNFHDSGEFNCAQTTHVTVERDDDSKILNVMWGLPAMTAAEDFAGLEDLVGDELADVMATCHCLKAEIEQLKEQLFASQAEAVKLKSEIESLVEINHIEKVAEGANDE